MQQNCALAGPPSQPPHCRLSKAAPLPHAHPKVSTKVSMSETTPTSWTSWAWSLAVPLLTLLALTWAIGQGHWLSMYAYNHLDCHRTSVIGFFWAPLDQARPECVLLWRLANHAHWSLFDQFGKILQMLVPPA